MWILVLGGKATVESPEGAVATLQQLGCRVRTADLWDALGEMRAQGQPPSAVIVEALDEVDAGRAALMRVRAEPSLRDVPVVLAVTVRALSRLDSQDGFDDFVLVPYVPAELYARVRRAEWRKSDFADHERIKVGELTLDLGAHEATVRGARVDLTHQEFALLSFLCRHRGRVFSRDQLLERVWSVDYYGGSRTVDIHVRRLRAKLGLAFAELETVRGVGYKVRAP